MVIITMVGGGKIMAKLFLKEMNKRYCDHNIFFNSCSNINDVYRNHTILLNIISMKDYVN
ncbi:hypothetical protein Metlim_0409 [Methanoplanus limicola DSM 2279]|uniref:Uncharacterized protein n=1 Tax=Methanoplanus limicola DSM 2279 TaxID=937775 RepID=H1Z1M2_9EURY|nr:hypothetical protein Metlim_0409 [Methanoplanus limicola DSM 2279]